MTDLDLDALQAAAEAATPGPWGHYYDVRPSVNPSLAAFLVGPSMRVIGRDIGFKREDAAFIGAANPAVVLALIGRLRKAEATREGWKLVPVEPTEEMQVAFDEAHHRACFRIESYKDMLAAAPASPDSEGGKE